MKFGIKGITLVELLISLAICALLLSAVTIIFTNLYNKLYRSVDINRANTAVIYTSEIINYDLIRAGYNYDNSSIDPVIWYTSNKTLEIRFVDYTKSGCENEIWSNGTNCNYIIRYRFDSNNKVLYRIVDVGADGTDLISSILPPQIEVDNFTVTVDSNNKTVSYIIEYTFPGLRNERKSNISNQIICRNWRQ